MQHTSNRNLTFDPTLYYYILAHLKKTQIKLTNLQKQSIENSQKQTFH